MACAILRCSCTVVPTRPSRSLFFPAAGRDAWKPETVMTPFRLPVVPPPSSRAMAGPGRRCDGVLMRFAVAACLLLACMHAGHAQPAPAVPASAAQAATTVATAARPIAVPDILARAEEDLQRVD